LLAICRHRKPKLRRRAAINTIDNTL
jgi:hypothetical protein